MTVSARCQQGFTLVEAVVATAIMLTVTAGVFTVLSPSQGIFQTQPEVADMQQRLRIGIDTLEHDLLMAGAGRYAGHQAGSLAHSFAPVLPFRRGWSASYGDGPGVFRDDRITVYYVPATASHTTVAAAMATPSSVIAVSALAGCPAINPLCGFAAGTVVAVYDGSGAFDTFAVTGVGSGVLPTIEHAQQGTLSKAYPEGSQIAKVEQHTYFLDSSTRQLMHYDGFSTATPVIDNVVGLAFEFYGEPTPPVFRKPGLDLTTTYGPPPPPAGAVVPGASWPPGENCMWQLSGEQQVPRDTLASLGAGSGLVAFTAAQLSDGPWCPDAGHATRYDADLLRIRRIRVTLRVQAGNDALRGPLGGGSDALFTNAGTARHASRTVPDQTVRFDVSPRNLNLAR